MDKEVAWMNDSGSCFLSDGNKYSENWTALYTSPPKREPLSIQYKNKITGDAYLLKTVCHVKIGDKWVDGIAYVNANAHREMYVRTKDDFFNSFEEIIEGAKL